MKRSLSLTIIFFLLLPASIRAYSIVSLKPNITLTLIALGAQNDVVGVTKFCAKPNGKSVIVADYVSLDVEKIVRLKPDIALSSKENSQNRQYEALTNAGVRVAYLDFKTLDDLFASVKKIGALIGRVPESEKIFSEMRRTLHEARKLAMPHKNKTFGVIVQRQPLMIASGNTFISTLLSEAGLKNVFEKNRIAYPTLDAETLIGKNPDFLFDMDMVPDSESGKPYFGHAVVTIRIEDFLSAPQSLIHLKKLVETFRH